MKQVALLLMIVMLGNGCGSNDSAERVSCATAGLTLSVSAVINATSCKAVDGSITVRASGGTGPYDFNLNGGVFQTNPRFDDVGPGTYAIKVKDLNGCEASIEATVAAPNSDLSAQASAVVADNLCVADNGSLQLAATGGAAPYQFKLPGGVFSDATTYNNLKHGTYAVIVKDANECQVTVSLTVPRGNTGISYQTEIKPIFEATCIRFSGCHGPGTGPRDWTNFANVKREATLIKTRTGNRSMPISPAPSLTQQQIDVIACWVDDGANEN
ncbi:MAG: SprB repeat-containing protein [Cyclobacteriaceae bacterium]|jgi:hypothetical protein|nr:SprB repeat-containing protein [Cyclobacteriaceae bacterium]